MAKSSAKVVGPENIAPDLLGLTVDIATLTPDPRNARKHNDRNLAAVSASLTRFGQTKPIVVDADGVVLAGNGSLTAAKQLGWKRIAVSRVPLAGADARAYAIADNRTAELAEWDWEELAVQTKELGSDTMLAVGWNEADLEALAHTNFDAPQPAYIPVAPLSPYQYPASVPIVAPHSALPPSQSDSAEETKSLYTQRVDTPIYVPTGPKPELSTLLTRTKTQQLLARIEQSSVPDDVKDFLRAAAYRHDQFNFKLIAEFYAHADADVQALFEESALVIIDINKAIEFGFVDLTARMKAIFGAEQLLREGQAEGTDEAADDDA